MKRDDVRDHRLERREAEPRELLAPGLGIALPQLLAGVSAEARSDCAHGVMAFVLCRYSHRSAIMQRGAGGLARRAHVAAVQDQPVVRILAEIRAARIS